jgi:hypothetical protein
MANRQQDQNQNQNQTRTQKKGRTNPGTFSPDDDEAQEADQTQLGGQQQARGDGSQEPDEPLSEIEQDEDMDDEDTENESMNRPS